MFSTSNGFFSRGNTQNLQWWTSTHPHWHNISSAPCPTSLQYGLGSLHHSICPCGVPDKRRRGIILFYILSSKFDNCIYYWLVFLHPLWLLILNYIYKDSEMFERLHFLFHQVYDLTVWGRCQKLNKSLATNQHYIRCWFNTGKAGNRNQRRRARTKSNTTSQQ